MEGWRGERTALRSVEQVTNELVSVGGSAFLGALVSTFAARGLGADFVLPVWGYPLAALLVEDGAVREHLTVLIRFLPPSYGLLGVCMLVECCPAAVGGSLRCCRYGGGIRRRIQSCGVE